MLYAHTTYTYSFGLAVLCLDSQQVPHTQGELCTAEWEVEVMDFSIMHKDEYVHPCMYACVVI